MSEDVQALVDEAKAKLAENNPFLERVTRRLVEALQASQAENDHRFDSQHIHDKGVYPKPRLADVVLYEAAGLPPLQLDGSGSGEQE